MRFGKVPCFSLRVLFEFCYPCSGLCGCYAEVGYATRVVCSDVDGARYGYGGYGVAAVLGV